MEDDAILTISRLARANEGIIPGCDQINRVGLSDLGKRIRGWRLAVQLFGGSDSFDRTPATARSCATLDDLRHTGSLPEATGLEHKPTTFKRSFTHQRRQLSLLSGRLSSLSPRENRSDDP